MDPVLLQHLYRLFALIMTTIQTGHTALYLSVFDLAQDMAEAEATGTRKELIDNICKVDLLEIAVRCYAKGSIIMTPNRPVGDWGQVLGNAAAAGAILDHFLHHAEIIGLQ